MQTPVPTRSEEPPNTSVQSNEAQKGASLRPTKIAKLYKRLNSPLSVTVLGGLAVLVISTRVQNQYWVSQQRFLNDQTIHAHKIEATILTEEEIVRAAGKRLTGAAILVGAHEGHFDDDQHDKSIGAYNLSRREWDDLEEVLKLRLSIYYPDEAIQKSWRGLLLNMDNLDKSVIGLDKFSPADKSANHSRATASAREAIRQIEEDLGHFSSQLTRYMSNE